MAESYILRLNCKDRPGIVNDVTSFFFKRGFNIEESSQFMDPYSGGFFMRTVLKAVHTAYNDLELLTTEFARVAESFEMSFSLRSADRPMRVLIAVSKWGHCLNHMLTAWKRGSLPIEIVGVVSNHPDQQALVDWFGLPYFFLPITPSTKSRQEGQMLDLIQSTGAELLVLARYMQVLSSEMCTALSGRAINIHHSFLPSFKGSKPYHRAHERGVKLIGATAHYITADLDEGPIIEQAVERVSHALSPEELVEIGRDIESSVLTRAVRWHAEDRVLANGSRTVVFSA